MGQTSGKPSDSFSLNLADPGVEFRWLDAERLIRYGDSALADLHQLLSARGFDGYALLSTERARADLPELDAGAQVIVNVPHAQVPRAAAGIREQVSGMPLVALGGGRVIDTAKAIGAVGRQPVAAVPMTLSGAEMTRIHRLPEGVTGVPLTRPALVVADPDLMTSQPIAQRAASTFNALAHAIEAIYGPYANPVAELAAMRAIALLLTGIEKELRVEPLAGKSFFGTPRADGREATALGSLLAGYALDAAGFAIHHALCQTIVRIAETPHAETNAIVLPHVVRLVTGPASQIQTLMQAVTGSADPAARLEELAALAGLPARLSELGADENVKEAILEAALKRPELGFTPGGAGRIEVEAILEICW